ncbi:uncharacterized protein [Palaemon carinicauda]
MSSIEGWKGVEAATWEPISILGPQWMVKSDTSDRGYIVMLTDGCGIWGEKRASKYILDQADEWASCIEAGIIELSRLVLSEMKKTAILSWEDNRGKAKLSINSKLNDMSYSWEFHMTRLDDELFYHHWTIPLLVHCHHLGLIKDQLTKELENKNRQLEELLPDNKKSKASNKSLKNKDSSIQVSAEAVLNKGLSSILEDQSFSYLQIMASLQKIRNPENNQVTMQKGQKGAIKNNAKIMNQMEGKTEEEFEEEELRKQEERRAKIQEMMEGNDTPTTPQKKKKKLKI